MGPVYIDSEGQIGKLKTYVSNIAMNLQEYDLLQQQKTPMTFLLSQKQTIKNASTENLKRYYWEQSQTVGVIHKEDVTGVGLSQVPTTLLLKWLTHKPVWEEQWRHYRRITERTACTGTDKCSTH